MRYRAIFTGVYSGLPSPSGGDCRIMITADHKPSGAAFVNTNGERRLLSAAAITANLARVSRINSFKRPASISVLLFVIVKKPPQASSLIAWARWRFLTIPQSNAPLVRLSAPAFAIRGGALVHRPAGTDSLHGGNKMIYKPASISPDFRPRSMALMLFGFLLVSTIFSPPGGADQS